MNTRMTSLLRTLLAWALVVTVAWLTNSLISARAAGNGKRPVVVELFTSQGCSSCPPADALMLELAKRDDIIALSLPVDYWDNMGWADTFASPRHTARQRAYAKTLPNRRVYTPQMVINGTVDLVGSHRDEVLETISKEVASPAPFIPITLGREGDHLTISLGDAPPALAGRKAWIWIAPYHGKVQSVAITKGENAGNTFKYTHVVDGLKKIGDYDGSKLLITHEMDEMMAKNIDDCAIIVQDSQTGAILGATHITWPSAG